MPFDLSFVSDASLKAVLLRDVEEFDSSLEHSNWKCAVVMAGSVVEALLADQLIAAGLNENNVHEMVLAQLIEEAHRQKLISDTSLQISNLLRTYRNLIHVGRELRTRTSPDKKAAKLATSLLEHVADDLKGLHAADGRPRIDDVLSKISADPLSRNTIRDLIVAMAPHERFVLVRESIPDHLKIDLTDQVLDSLVESYHFAYNRLEPAHRKVIVSDFAKTISRGSAGFADATIINFCRGPYLVDGHSADSAAIAQFVKDRLCRISEGHKFEQFGLPALGMSGYWTDSEKFAICLSVLLAAQRSELLSDLAAECFEPLSRSSQQVILSRAKQIHGQASSTQELAKALGVSSGHRVNLVEVLSERQKKT